MRFEPLKYEHLKQMVLIEQEAFNDMAWSERMFIPEVENKNAHYVVGVMADGEVVCYGGFHAVEDEAHITNIAVKDIYRGKGYGKFLLSELIEQAKNLGCNNITLEVKITNVPAINLYLSYGFKAEGIRPKYYSDGKDAVLMWLRQ